MSSEVRYEHFQTYKKSYKVRKPIDSDNHTGHNHSRSSNIAVRIVRIFRKVGWTYISIELMLLLGVLVYAAISLLLFNILAVIDIRHIPVQSKLIWNIPREAWLIFSAGTAIIVWLAIYPGKWIVNKWKQRVMTNVDRR